MSNETNDFEIAAPEQPNQFDTKQVELELVEVEQLIGAKKARETFSVDGDGHTVAVLDTGLRVSHVDFAGRVPAQLNLTADNGGKAGDAADGQGHGTNVGGIIVAGGIHTGMAPAAQIVPIKVLPNAGPGSFQAVEDGLQWVIDNHDEFDITAVCMSLGAENNMTDDSVLVNNGVRRRIAELRDLRIPVVIAAGNDFFTHNSEQGMSFPAIIREAVSVGAVFDAFNDGFVFDSGAIAFSGSPDAITPFSQRLHESVSPQCRTDIFAPGAPVTSSGINNDHAVSVQQGTSQAAPVVAGVIMLMQQFHVRCTGHLPTVDDLVKWMRLGGVTIHDGDDEDDNVRNTRLDFIRISAFASLDQIRRAFEKKLAFEGVALQELSDLTL